MNNCRTCGQDYADYFRHCPVDGTLLTPVVPDDDPLIGRLLDNRYRLDALLGKGTFGRVYRAENVQLGRTEAIKVILLDRFQNPERVVRDFRKEAKLLARLGERSRHIVQVYNYGEEEGLFFFAMEYVAGEPLSAIVREEGPMDPPRAIGMIRQTCMALRVAHDSGVVHRDLKLDNLMRVAHPAGERIKVLDFGIAKVLEGAETQAFLDPDDPEFTYVFGPQGTPGYAPAEQMEGKDVDERTDLFALGVILYQLMTGHEPWLGKDVPQGLTQGEAWGSIGHPPELAPIPLSRWRSDLPNELQAVVSRLLQKKPGRRYGSATELDRVLEPIERGLNAPAAIDVRTEPTGATVRLARDGESIAEGAAPWHHEGLPPGDYRLEILADGFESETRDLELTPDSTREVSLKLAPAATRPFYRSPKAWSRLARRPAMFGGVGLAATIALVFVLSSNGDVRDVSYSGFMSHLGDDEIESLALAGGRILGRLGPDNGDETLRLDMAGRPIQTFLRDMYERGVRMPPEGEGRLLLALRPTSVQAVGEGPVAMLTHSEGDACAPCEQGTIHVLRAGWYRVASPDAWRIDSVAVRDAEGVYPVEIVRAGKSDSLTLAGAFFLRAGALTEVTLFLSPTDPEGTPTDGLVDAGPGRKRAGAELPPGDPERGPDVGIPDGASPDETDPAPTPPDADADAARQRADAAVAEAVRISHPARQRRLLEEAQTAYADCLSARPADRHCGAERAAIERLRRTEHRMAPATSPGAGIEGFELQLGVALQDRGIRFRQNVRISGRAGEAMCLNAYVYDDRGRALLSSGAGAYTLAGHTVQFKEFVPDRPQWRFNQLDLFMPYVYIQLPEGRYDLEGQVKLWPGGCSDAAELERARAATGPLAVSDVRGFCFARGDDYSCE